MEFEDKLRELINQCSQENESDTPDYILAKYVKGCLDAFNNAVFARDKWHGFKPWEDNPVTELPSTTPTP